MPDLQGWLFLLRSASPPCSLIEAQPPIWKLTINKAAKITAWMSSPTPSRRI
jgi:hypothetical protein